MNINKHTLIRYFLGQSSNEEKDAIHYWLESNSSNKQQFINERIRFDASILIDEKEIRSPRHEYIHPFVIFGLKIAATLLLLVGSIYLYDSYKWQQIGTKFQTMRVPAGNRANLTLPDGTVVWLNANTSLKYPIAFTKDKREVILDGEAYFDVVKNKKPFIVKTNKYNVEVMGTTFNVEAYSNKSDFMTALFEGKIKLFNSENEKDNTYLQPGQTATLENGKLIVSITGDANVYRWKDGIIYIENKSFPEIMKLFEKYYDIQINIQNKEVASLGYKGKLRIADGIDHALRVLQNDFPFKYKRNEETDIIDIY